VEQPLADAALHVSEQRVELPEPEVLVEPVVGHVIEGLLEVTADPERRAGERVLASALTLRRPCAPPVERELLDAFRRHVIGHRDERLVVGVAGVPLARHRAQVQLGLRKARWDLAQLAPERLNAAAQVRVQRLGRLAVLADRFQVVVQRAA
jgi:hypothetical protein